MRPGAGRVVLTVALAAAGLAACAKGDPTGARLVLAEARLVVTGDDGPRHVLTVSAAGEIALDGAAQFTLRPDGHIVVGGQAVARVERDGAISVHSVRTNAVVRDDAAFVLDGAVELEVGDDGAVTGPLLATMDHPRLRVDGARLRYEGPPAARRAAMIGLAGVVTNLPARVGER